MKMPTEGRRYGKYISKVFCVEKTCQRPSVLRRSVEDPEILRLIWGEDLSGIFYKAEVVGLLCGEDLSEVFCEEKICQRFSMRRRPISGLFKIEEL